MKVDVSNANVSDNKDTLGVGMLVGVLANMKRYNTDIEFRNCIKSYN